MALSAKTVVHGDKVITSKFTNSNLLGFTAQHKEKVGQVGTFHSFYQLGVKKNRAALIEFSDGSRLVWRMKSLDPFTEETSLIPCKEEMNPNISEVSEKIDRTKEKSILERAKAINGSKQISSMDKVIDKITGSDSEVKPGEQMQIKFTVQGKDSTIHQIEKDKLLALLDNPKELAQYIKDLTGVEKPLPDMKTVLEGIGYIITVSGKPVEVKYKTALKEVVFAPCSDISTAEGYANLSKLLLLRDLWNDSYLGERKERWAVVPAINEAGHPVYLIERANTYPRVLSFFSRKMAENFLSTFKEYISLSRKLL